ncbi:MAG: hypothetical protein AVDCRST_MAG35-2166 [uncultured Quadrisphaera sp.]|uniref:Uncharacterized protein n=1 Tax=uncultured Quadrisphaera sp. TaxID=904978 RepID=A0A6J4PRE1_9ACTN|nr:MAG: hypothetical protein AVDCRST_MAG35-2166 [uncultured Quadrisphaera sp.]
MISAVSLHLVTRRHVDLMSVRSSHLCRRPGA